MAGRKKNLDALRGQIDVSGLLDILEKHVLGERDVSSTQVSVALALLKKALPDLSEPPRRPAEETGVSHEEALRELE